MKKTSNINNDVSIRRNAYLKKTRTYSVIIQGDGQARNALKTCKLLDECGEIGESLSVVKNLVIQNPCCRQVSIHGAFLAVGSISAPEKFYHFEIVCATRAKAERLKNTIATLDMDTRITMRKKYYVIYIKEGDRIVDILSVMGAPVALMKFENARIVKDMRNSINRQVNYETANINKTVSTAIKQIEDIIYMRGTIDFDGLPESLLEVAKVRLEKPEATLKELGELFDPSMGKSGLNHRLRKLSILAEEHREKCGTSEQQETTHRNEEGNYGK